MPRLGASATGERMELENVHTLGDKSHRVVGRDQRWRYRTGKHLPQIPQGLAQALSRLLVGYVAPEEGGQGFAGMRSRARDGEIGQQRPTLSRAERYPWT